METLSSSRSNGENSCWDSFLSHEWNPKNWHVTSDKVTRFSAIIFAICLAVLIVAGIMVSYPQVTGAFFTILGLGAAASLITLIIGLVKNCNQKKPVGRLEQAENALRNEFAHLEARVSNVLN